MRLAQKLTIATLKACKLVGVRRAVLHTLLTPLADYAGRSHVPYRTIATLSGVSPRACVLALHYLIAAGFVIEEQRGSGRRPSWLRVVVCEAKD